MKSTYAAPAATTRGDVVDFTLGKNPGSEVISPSQLTGGGSSLSFGL